MGEMHHYRTTYKQGYKKLKKRDDSQDSCTYCSDPTFEERTVEQTNAMRLIHIRTKYDIFEGRKVESHYMIVPKRHVESISQFTDAEKIEMMSLIGKYEIKGYNTYARGVKSISRSVAHQHTHLIKLQEKRTKFLLYIAKPYHLIQR